MEKCTLNESRLGQHDSIFFGTCDIDRYQSLIAKPCSGVINTENQTETIHESYDRNKF